MMEVDFAYVCTILAIIGLFYYWLSKDLEYFHDKPIPSMAAKPFVGSSGGLLFKKYSFQDFIRKIYDQYAGVKVFGMFDTNIPMFVIRDPQLIKQIGVKDFDHFMDHRPIFGAGSSHDDANNPNMLFGKTLFGLNDQKWKTMRATLSPAFTGSKMRQMFALIVDCSESMVKYYQEQSAGGMQLECEMKDVCSRFTNDVIATCAFGFRVDSHRNRDNDFYKKGKEMMDFSRTTFVFRTLGYRFIPSIMNYLEIDFLDHKYNKYFSSLIKDAVSTREARGIVRPDMVNMLMQARKGLLKHQRETDENEGFAVVQESELGKAEVTKVLSEPEMIAQCLIFFLAGFDTVSTNLTFLMHALTVNPEVQQKLYEEVLETNRSLNGGSLTYDALQKMQYLDMAVTESLRMWPPVPAVDRLCVQNYELDDGEGLKFTIEKGVGVWFPISGLHYDPKYYPDPERFLPERFSEENKNNIDPNTYLPFGIGPRNCIGSRFALLEIKTIVYYMLRSFSFERTSKTEMPLQIRKGFVPTAAENGIYLEFRPRKVVSE